LKGELKWFFDAVIVGFALLQFTNPARTNPLVVGDLMTTNVPPPQVAAMLHAACYDLSCIFETKSNLSHVEIIACYA
jgi:hypothetical protein